MTEEQSKYVDFDVEHDRERHPLPWYLLVPRYNYYKHKRWAEIDPDVIPLVNDSAMRTLRIYTLFLPVVLARLTLQIISLCFEVLSSPFALLVDGLQMLSRLPDNLVTRLDNWIISRNKTKKSDEIFDTYLNGMTLERHTKLNAVFPNLAPFKGQHDEQATPHAED